MLHLTSDNHFHNLTHLPDPVFLPGIWCPAQSCVQATNLFTSLRTVFCADSMPNSLSLPFRKTLCDTERTVPSISTFTQHPVKKGRHRLADEMLHQPDVVRILLCFSYYVGSSLGAGFEMTEYEWPCASPFNSSLICSKKRGWTLRREEKLRAQSLTFQLWQWKKGRFVFLSLLPTKGIDFSIFNSAKKWAFSRTQVKTDHTWYYKDCQDQIKSPTLSNV